MLDICMLNKYNKICISVNIPKMHFLMHNSRKNTYDDGNRRFFPFQHKAGSGAFETKKSCFAVVVTKTP